MPPEYGSTPDLSHHELILLTNGIPSIWFFHTSTPSVFDSTRTFTFTACNTHPSRLVFHPGHRTVPSPHWLNLCVRVLPVSQSPAYPVHLSWFLIDADRTCAEVDCAIRGCGYEALLPFIDLRVKLPSAANGERLRLVKYASRQSMRGCWLLFLFSLQVCYRRRSPRRTTAARRSRATLAI